MHQRTHLGTCTVGKHRNLAFCTRLFSTPILVLNSYSDISRETDVGTGETYLIAGSEAFLCPKQISPL